MFRSRAKKNLVILLILLTVIVLLVVKRSGLSRDKAQVDFPEACISCILLTSSEQPEILRISGDRSFVRSSDAISPRRTFRRRGSVWTCLLIQSYSSHLTTNSRT